MLRFWRLQVYGIVAQYRLYCELLLFPISLRHNDAVSHTRRQVLGSKRVRSLALPTRPSHSLNLSAHLLNLSSPGGNGIHLFPIFPARCSFRLLTLSLAHSASHSLCSHTLHSFVGLRPPHSLRFARLALLIPPLAAAAAAAAPPPESGHPPHADAVRPEQLAAVAEEVRRLRGVVGDVEKEQHSSAAAKRHNAELSAGVVARVKSEMGGQLAKISGMVGAVETQVGAKLSDLNGRLQAAEEVQAALHRRLEDAATSEAGKQKELMDQDHVLADQVRELGDIAMRQKLELNNEGSSARRFQSEQRKWATEISTDMLKMDASTNHKLVSMLRELTARLDGERAVTARRITQLVDDLEARTQTGEAKRALDMRHVTDRFKALEGVVRGEAEARSSTLDEAGREAEAKLQVLTVGIQAAAKDQAEASARLQGAVDARVSQLRSDLQEFQGTSLSKIEMLEQVLRAEVKARMGGREKTRAELEAQMAAIRNNADADRDELSSAAGELAGMTIKRFQQIEGKVRAVQRECGESISAVVASQALVNAEAGAHRESLSLHEREAEGRGGKIREEVMAGTAQDIAHNRAAIEKLQAQVVSDETTEEKAAADMKRDVNKRLEETSLSLRGELETLGKELRNKLDTTVKDLAGREQTFQATILEEVATVAAKVSEDEVEMGDNSHTDVISGLLDHLVLRVEQGADQENRDARATAEASAREALAARVDAAAAETKEAARVDTEERVAQYTTLSATVAELRVLDATEAEEGKAYRLKLEGELAQVKAQFLGEVQRVEQASGGTTASLQEALDAVAVKTAGVDKAADAAVVDALQAQVKERQGKCADCEKMGERVGGMQGELTRVEAELKEVTRQLHQWTSVNEKEWQKSVSLAEQFMEGDGAKSAGGAGDKRIVPATHASAVSSTQPKVRGGIFPKP